MVSKATITRLDKVRTRSLKTTYKHLSQTEKQYIKLNEKLIQWQKEMTSFWLHVDRDLQRRASQNNDWDFYHLAESNLRKTEKQIERFLLKNDWTKQKALDVLKLHGEMNQLHCYGGSY